MSHNHKEKEKEFYTIDEVAEILGKDRSTIYNWLKKFEIEPRQFELDRKSYISRDELNRLRVRKPWQAKEKPRRKRATSHEKDDTQENDNH